MYRVPHPVLRSRIPVSRVAIIVLRDVGLPACCFVLAEADSRGRAASRLAASVLVALTREGMLGGILASSRDVDALGEGSCCGSAFLSIAEHC